MRLIDADALIKEIKMDIEDVGLQEKMVFYRINEALQAEPSDGDLISRQDAIEAVENNSYGMGSRASVKAIKELPSADAVEAVRCKDCKHRYVSGNGTTNYYVCDFMEAQYEDDGFCHHGEKVKP